MASHYAVTQFKLEVDEWGVARKMVQPGDKITADDLGVSKDEFQELIDMGSISTEPYTPPDANGVIPSTIDTTPPVDSYKDMTPEALKELADSRNLEVTGTGKDGAVKKVDLINALEEADKNAMDAEPE